MYTYTYVVPDAPNSGVTIFPYESSSAVPRIDYLSVIAYTIAPERYDVYLVVPGDYSGVYNVTDSAGTTVGRRYVGEPRFVSVVFNGTATKATVLVPRSVFFDTRMYADLQDASKLGQMPYKDPVSGQEKMKGYQNGTGLSNSDVIQMAFAFDGLADGQELFVKSVKTPKRYPLPDLTWTSADPMTLLLSAPGWALASATLMTGFTHPDMGQLEAKLLHFAPSPFDRSVTLRSNANAGEANNFTSYDLLNLGYMRDEFLAGGTWVANAYDRASGKTGQIEYYQIQVTLHTLPNRADTDADGLNDSEEMNLGSDGFATDPWKAMCTPMPSATISSRPDGRRGGRPSSQTRAASTWLPWSAQKGIS